MLIVLSPAKSLDEGRARDKALTAPRFLAQAQDLVDRMRGKTPKDLQKMMDISPALASLNWHRFQDWTPDGAFSAASLFDGDAYKTLRWDDLDADTQATGQLRLRLLSGLYGLLRPLDAIAPYRLEMGRALAPGEPLVAYWGARIAHALDADAEAVGARWLLNLASEEYASSIDRRALRLPVVSPVFKDRGKDGFKVVSFHAKRARGAMVRWALLHHPTHPDDLLAFSWKGYAWDPRSAPDAPTFLREAQDGDGQDG